MSQRARVLEKFNVTGLGWSYLVQYEPEYVFHVGELWYDLSGNRFEVASIGQLSGEAMEKMLKKGMTYLVLRPLDQNDVQGTVLIKD